MRLTLPLSLMLALLLGVAFAQMSIPMTRRAPYKAPFHMRGQSVNLRGGYINVGEYFATIQVGGQDVVVDVDTGSSTLAIPDANCDGSCPTSDPAYDSSRSHFFEKIQCGNSQCSSSFCYNDVRFHDQCSFGITYGDGSGLSGVAAKDRISIGGYTGSAMFGRILHEVGSFSGPGQAPGILGVAYRSLNCAPCPAYGGYCNPPCYDTVLDRLHAESGMPRKFGMCLTPEGGIWDLGFIDSNKAATPIQYVPVVAGRNGYDYYTVNLHNTRVGTTDVPMIGGYQNQMTIVDSGTTLIIAPNAWLTSLKHAMVAANLPLANQLFSFDFYGSPPTIPMTNAQASQYPDLTFQFDNSVTVTLKWYDYLMDLAKDGQTRTLGMAGDNNNLFILGDTFMQAAYVVFDQETNRVGFAPLKAGTCGSGTAAPGAHNRSLLGDSSSSQDWTLPIAGGVVGVVVALVAVAVVTAVRRRRSAAYVEVSSKPPAESPERDLEAHHEGAPVTPVAAQPAASPVVEAEMASVDSAVVASEAESQAPAVSEAQQLIPAESASS